MKPPWKTPRHSPPAFPTFPQLRRRLRLLEWRSSVANGNRGQVIIAAAEFDGTYLNLAVSTDARTPRNLNDVRYVRNKRSILRQP